MIRTHISEACEARDLALLDAVLFVTRTKGPLTQAKQREAWRGVLGDPEVLDPRRELLADRLARRTGSSLEGDALFSSLRVRLPDVPNRLLAYGLALRAATAHGGHPGPVRLPLAQLCRELGLTQAQARDMRLGLLDGMSPVALAAESAHPRHARVLETVLLAAGLEAHLTEAETLALDASREDTPVLLELTGQLLRRIAFGSHVASPLEALCQRLTDIALAPATLAQRWDTLRLAYCFSHAVGHDLGQQLLLDLLQELLHLGTVEAARATARESART
ncbi:hypothetical protein HJC10_18935 [Corallococcus exiguus]|uniref:hypothetical protein n=1 Tax=Corallococcus exiguus TaxID=83462 RepID=UPI0014711914|nr:hypothetical protein [Corallococcus exiguus]NNB88727.1 hypothetical protein [Corallococcus exiguus]NNB96202.1 hypothetical protein [Corallococcus exiguus]NNC04920.1 hypothetical protein [Corallococcus exiguus]